MRQISNRTTKTAQERVHEILDVSQALFVQKGYEATSVQETIDAVGIAKGTFYHYFRSKSDLLDAVVERIVEQTVAVIHTVVDNSQLDALAKFRQIFVRSNSWKLQHQDLLIELLRVMYRPENAILRDRVRSMSMEVAGPLLAKVIRQGVEEGVFHTEDPEEVALIVLHMGQAVSDTIAHVLLSAQRDEEVARRVGRRARAYERSIERVLGASPGSLDLRLQEMFAQWLARPKADL
mgnify:CR=1 FL=1